MASNKIKVIYEWVVLVMDQNADIIECLQHDKYDQALECERNIELPNDYEGCVGTTIELVKMEFNIDTHSLEDRYHAQLDGIFLPETYDDPAGGKFPKKLQQEIDRYHKKNVYIKPKYRDIVMLENF